MDGTGDINLDLIKRARRRLETVYDPKSTDEILKQVNTDALKALEGVRSSTNPMQRRKDMNKWLREWRNKNEKN